MFSERLKLLRKEKNMTQIELAAALGVSKGTVAMWETDKRRPDFEMLGQLSDLFDCRIDYILGFSDDASPVHLSVADIDQLGRWDLEDRYREMVKDIMGLDEFGESAVKGLVNSEKLRCLEQQSLRDTSNVRISISIK